MYHKILSLITFLTLISFTLIIQGREITFCTTGKKLVLTPLFLNQCFHKNTPGVKRYSIKAIAKASYEQYHLVGLIEVT